MIAVGRGLPSVDVRYQEKLFSSSHTPERHADRSTESGHRFEGAGIASVYSDQHTWRDDGGPSHVAVWDESDRRQSQQRSLGGRSHQ
jgi:hypothetical protein